MEKTGMADQDTFLIFDVTKQMGKEYKKKQNEKSSIADSHKHRAFSTRNKSDNRKSEGKDCQYSQQGNAFNLLGNRKTDSFQRKATSFRQRIYTAPVQTFNQ